MISKNERGFTEMKRLKSLLVISLAATMLLGNAATVAAAEQDMNISIENADAVQDVTAQMQGALKQEVAEAQTAYATDNDRFVGEAAKQLLSKKTYEYTNSAEISRLVQLGYACNQGSEPQGPFFITKGVMKEKSFFGLVTKKKDVYVVCISGTDTDAVDQSTGIVTDLLCGFEFDNRYIQNIKKAMLTTIPKGANVYVTGHSLGGMVGQQVASDKTLKDKYNILNTVTFGSPVINGFKREGTVKRLGDTSDVIPYASLTTFTNVIWQAAGLNREDGGYGWNVMGAHVESYNRVDEWGEYDVTGTKGGNTTLTMDFSTTKFFHSPVSFN